MKPLRLIICYIFLISSLSQPAFAADLNLPDMGDPSGAHFGLRLESQVGEAFMRYVRANSRIISHPLFSDYVQQLGNKLARHSNTRGRKLTFFVVDETTINAFAGPGGYIGIHSGLIQATDTEDELAAVLAHEIAHIEQKHLARMIQMTNEFSVPLAGLILAGLVLGATGGAGSGAAAVATGQAAMAQRQLNFTRANEREADNIGIRILSKSHFDPTAMASFFQKLYRGNSRGAMVIPEFLQTHPVTSDRIADALSRANSLKTQQHKEDLRYHLLKNWLRVKDFTSSRSAIAHFESVLKDGRYRNKEAARFGLAYSYLRNRNYPKALSEINTLLKIRTNYPIYLYTKAKIHIANGNKSAAASTISRAKSQATKKALSLSKAEIYLQASQPKRAASLLKAMLKSHTNDANLYKIYGRAAASSGNKATGHAALAEYYYLNGNLEQAIMQLNIALKQKKLSFYTKTGYEARIKQIDQELRALK